MHIHIDDQETGASLTLCVDRNTGTCTILRGAPELIPSAVTIATSLKVSAIRYYVDESGLSNLDLLDQGWKVTSTRVLELKLNGKASDGKASARSV